MHVVNDTIAALATAQGRGGIGVIRVSGTQTGQIIQSILGCTLVPRHASYLPFYDAASNVIDEGIAIYFPGPHSFTGEDVLELQGHGGPVVIDLLLHAILKAGARLARPGEFSERAFLNGKMDLTQAEAIADLIDASSKQAARSALRSMQGAFSKAVNALNEKIIQLRMYIEAAIDFSDEQIDLLSDNHLCANLAEIMSDLEKLQRDAKQGSLLRDGITVVIAGEPNVGKSSLLNALSGKDLAIVTDIPGTTRDVLRDYIHMDGMPIHVVDTAGLRTSDDVVEQEGIRRAQQEIAKADIILQVVSDNDSPVAIAISHTCPKIVVRNKIDLTQALPAVLQTDQGYEVLLSAKTGEGLDLLKQQIKTLVGYENQSEGLFLARRRHLEALARTSLCLCAAKDKLYSGNVLELAAEELRLAQQALNDITGEFSSDDLLGKIFSSFCIGK